MATVRSLKLFDSLTRAIQPVPAGDRLGFYCCGPTVYGRAHIGNFRTFVCTDLLVRTLKAFGYPVRFVRNITDVDDKTIRGAHAEKVPLAQFTARHEAAFQADCKALALLAPDVEPRATAHIADMIALIERLLENDHAYVADDGSVYYRIASFKDYGCLCHLDREGLRAGARVAQDEYEKESIADFVLWKKHRPEDGDVRWDSPWGSGRPGWHIECSAMSMKYLGESYELHGGGIDLLFPHHENEIAQSEAATGKPFVKHWWHAAHLLVDGKKMSKSLGNLYTLEDVREMGFEPNFEGQMNHLRYALISVHYRDSLNFTKDSLAAAAASIQRLQNFYTRLKYSLDDKIEADGLSAEQTGAAFLERFYASLENDLNISAALGTLFSAVTDINALIDRKKLSEKESKGWINALQSVDGVLQVGITRIEELPLSEVFGLITERDEARKAKDWAESDRLRGELESRGFIVKDTPTGTKVEPRR